ncbi:SpoIIE family protein phosphatase [Methanocrinis sp.]|uniref:SpoIIE family protein phosphatase n=1 Tax=Methanocrinis sp. TaxID=3101522 RepID=UPI003D0AA3C7
MASIEPIGAISILDMGGNGDAAPDEDGNATSKGPTELIAAGVWIAPDGGENVSAGVEETLLSISGPSRVLRITVQEEEVSELGYIGTSDGVLILWPDVTETLRLIAPFDYRERPWYLEAARSRETIWTRPYLSQASGSLAITCATPILVEGNLTGVVGMDISLAEIDSDLANLSSGYPFLLDGQGAVVMRPDAPESFLWEEILMPGSLLDSKNRELADLAEAMVQGESGTIILRLSKGMVRISYAPLPTVGWSLGLVSSDQELAAAKASQYDQLFRRISGQTEVLALETGEALKDRGPKAAAPGSQDGGEEAEPPSIWPLALAAAAISAILAGLAGFRAGRRGVSSMVKAVERALEGIGRGDPEPKIEGYGSRDMSDLGEAFERMAVDLEDRISHVEKRSFETGRAEKEKEVYGEVRRFLLPERSPQIEGYEVATLSLVPGCEDVQFYDFFEMEGSKSVVVMAEVSGKGVSAAMVAALTRSMIRAASRRFGDPAKALRETNFHVSDDVRSGMMVSCFCGMLDLSSHSMNYANAGHAPPFIVSSDGFVDTLIGGAISMGALDHIDLEMEGWMIDPGDVLVIYNDGLIEVENEDNERFGTENLIALIKNNRERSAQDIMKELEAAIKGHVGSQPKTFHPAAMMVKRSV